MPTPSRSIRSRSLCGVPAGLDTWWTQAQLEYVQGAAGPEIDRVIQDAMTDAFKGIKGVTFEPNSNFTIGIDSPGPIVEPDDMIIVAPRCHSNEPVKVPEGSMQRVHCLICGSTFAA